MNVENFEEVKELMAEREKLLNAQNFLISIEDREIYLQVWSSGDNADRFDTRDLPRFHSISRDLARQVLKNSLNLIGIQIQGIDAQLKEL